MRLSLLESGDPRLQLPLEVEGTQAGGEGLRQLDVVSPEDHQVHGRQELLQTQAAVLGHVRQLPDGPELADGKSEKKTPQDIEVESLERQRNVQLK